MAHCTMIFYSLLDELNAIHLCDDHIDTHIIDQPFYHTYKANNLYQQVIQLIQSVQIYTNESTNQYKHLYGYVLICSYRIAINHIYSEELSLGKKQLVHVLQEMKCNVLLYVLELIDGYNQLCILEKNHAMYYKSYEYTLIAIQYYRVVYEVKHSQHNVSGTQDDTDIKNVLNNTELHGVLYNNHTLSIYYLAQLLQSMSDSETNVWDSTRIARYSAQFCQISLNRQLMSDTFLDEKNQLFLMKWCDNVLKLSEYYITVHNYYYAIQCITIVHQICPRQCRTVKTLVHDDIDVYVALSADICMHYGEYYVELLKYSTEHKDDTNKISSIDNNKSIQSQSPTEPQYNSNTENKLSINTDELDSIIEFIQHDNHQSNNLTRQQYLFNDSSIDYSQCNYNTANTADEAKQLFIYGLTNLQQCQKIYQLNGHVSEYINIIKLIALLYKYYSVYITDIDTQCKLMKRQIDLYSSVTDVLNKSVYFDEYYTLCYLLADSCMNLGTYKHTQLKYDKRNQLWMKSIQYYTQYVQGIDNLHFSKTRHNDSNKDTTQLTIDSEYINYYINSLFYTGFLYYKLTDQLNENSIQLLNSSIDMYNQLVNCIQLHKLQDTYSEELSNAREMIDIIPLKIHMYEKQRFNR